MNWYTQFYKASITLTLYTCTNVRESVRVSDYLKTLSCAVCPDGVPL